jgi:hypothetical protein
VADQLQTNFAGDLRNILKCVFLVNASSSISTEEQDLEEGPVTAVSVEQETPSPPTGDNGKLMLSELRFQVLMAVSMKFIESSGM